MQGQPQLRNATAVLTHRLRRRVEMNDGSTNLQRSFLIEPDVADNSIHPMVKPCAGLVLIEVCNGARAGLLNDVVALMAIASQGISEPAQARQKLDQLAPYVIWNGCAHSVGILRAI